MSQLFFCMEEVEVGVRCWVRGWLPVLGSGLGQRRSCANWQNSGLCSLESPNWQNYELCSLDCSYWQNSELCSLDCSYWHNSELCSLDTSSYGHFSEFCPLQHLTVPFLLSIATLRNAHSFINLLPLYPHTKKTPIC